MMIAAFGLVVVMILADKERHIVGHGFHHAAVTLIISVCVILRALLIQGLAELIARLRIIVGVEIAVGIHAAHVIHCGSDGRLDARVVGGCIQGEASPAADAENADTLGVHIGACQQVIYGGTEILRTYFRRGQVARRTTALSVIRRGECYGKETAFGKRLCILRIELPGLWIVMFAREKP